MSDVDQREAREVGEKAAQFANFSQQASGTVTIHRVGDYQVEYKLSKLDAVAGLTKVMADGFINKEGNGVTPKFMDYLTPLLGSDMPRVGRLDPANRVKKILNK